MGYKWDYMYILIYDVCHIYVYCFLYVCKHVMCVCVCVLKSCHYVYF